ncbi:ATP-binding protein [Gramella jeungdoensis]|uniref:ATP-binding protein n=1 Tax=Gramella jeungdoensis TaxID=708091 RepID=A0ABT0YZJ2_9FLAO|nr:ATP-binding protein [Gramella jeungdoensis]MCM8568893.1 ATP-binding protein [Gramella jeungdoensis]
MTNYTNRLKKYWKSKDLAFIATFKRINKNAGFFNHFTNPTNKMKLFYPDFDGVEVLDKRVSFYYGNNPNLSDGAYYKVELEHTNNPKGKNNPFSLKIKTVTELNQDKVEKLLSKKNSDVDNIVKYIGEYHKVSEAFACFENVMFSETGEILMFQGESQKVYVSPNLELKQGGYYQFSFIENEGKLPSAIINTIQPKHNPYRELIEERFKLHNNPASNKANAKTMREIGIGMYSSKERMIYELLQNADDSPGKDKVEFHIDINGDYFFIMHDGAPFNKKDVKAITSAGESTKEKSKNKTGYKGIGFKSVFTNSSEVWIKSGGYQFAFLKHSELFKDFDSLYFPDERRAQFTEEGLKVEKERFLEQEEGFDSTLHVPWQLMPIWQEQLPQDFDEANFDRFNNPVQIALKLGRNNIENYKLAIDNISKRPQFLLFLRNTSKFNSRKNGVMILRKDHKNIIEILKLKGEENETHHYTKQVFNKIEISNEAFEQSGIGLKKKSDFNENTNTINNYFVDLDENRLDEIPPKLASVNQTEISFAIKIENQKIHAEEGYLNNSQNYSSLFTYLPMEDKRLLLPFLVNADFVPDSRRENLQYSNPWNQYIMIKVAEKHVAILAHFAQGFLKDQDTNSSYLSLLLKSPLSEDDMAQQIIESYNATYLEQLKKTAIVINDKDQIQLLSETIIDDSGLIELFGNKIFYDIVDTEKRLPNSNLDAKYLKDYDYLEVEVIDLKEIAEKITPELCESLGSIIAQKTLYEKPELLKWLNKLVKYIPDDFGKIPFIQHNNSPFSLEQLIDEDDAWLINVHTSQYETLLGELGYHTIQLNLDKYSNIKDFLLRLSGYINDKTLAYERIASNANTHKLPVASKLKLIDFFQNSTFMEGIGPDKYSGKLKLFTDENNIPRPVRHLISRKEALEVNSINKFRIKETEFNGLTDDLQKQLIAKDAIFTSFILDEDLFDEWSQQFDTKNINNYVSDLKAIYSWIDNPDDISSAQWASIPWLYIDDEARFETSDKVYWSKAFKNLKADKFEIIKTVFQTAELKILPIQECGALIKAFQIKTDDSSDIDWSEVEELEMMVANTLLDWMEDDGGFGDFFKNYTIVEKFKGNYKIEEIEAIQIFDGSDKDLKTYIQSNTELSLIFNELDKNLCSENRSMIGLLQGDRLIKAIIESEKYDQNLAVHLPTNIAIELLQPFITNIKEFKLFTSSDYGGDTAEHIIVHNILNKIDESEVVSEEISEVIKVLKAKTLINEQPLKHFDISNAISFGKGKIIKELHISDVLNKYDGETNVLEEIIESFTQITNKRKLRKHIFKTRILETQEIHYEIEKENSTFYSIEQVVFQLLDESFGNNRKWNKSHFDDHYKERGTEEQLHSSYQKFLDLLIKIDFTDLSNFIFHGLTLSICVDKNFAIESEYIPNWLNQWIEIDKENRLQFLSKLGYNGTDSTIVNLRKSMIDVNSDKDEIISFYTDAKSNSQITWNTIKWLSQYSPEIITKNKEIIRRINDSLTLNIDGTKGMVIPVIQVINNKKERLYKLEKIEFSSKLYFIEEDQEYDDVIFEKVKSENKDVAFVDSICGKMVNHFPIENIALTESIDEQVLQEKSKLWDADYYKNWKHYENCQIYIYDGNEIPHKKSYNNITITTLAGSLMEEYEGAFYFSKILKSSILNQKPTILPEEKFQSLKDFYIYFKENPDEFEKNPLEENYNETFDRMIQDRYGISEDRQNDENSNAKRQVLYYLKENGYEVNEGHSKNNFAALYGIKDSEGKRIDFIVKSARGGLLFINKSHWEMLDSSQTQLIAIYPKFEMRIFRDKMELLSDELQEKVLFRMPNKKSEREIDDVFDKTESDSHLILVTSKHMKESLFEKVGKKGTFNKNEEANVMDENIVIE